jgi:hypothetical protein
MRKRRETTNQNITWNNILPSIYHQEFSQVSTNFKTFASVFSKDGIQSVSLKTFNNSKTLLSTIPMTRDRVSGTTLIEEFDRWSLDMTLNGTEVYYRISVTDSIGRQNTWPRSGYAEFEQGLNSDLPLYINEFMASNDATIADPAGEFDDWIEIYNESQNLIDLSGMFLTDNPGNLDKWNFPAGTNINAEDFLIIWCDEDGDKAQDGLHANFKLSAGGEYIALVDTDSLSIIDHITFAAQSTDVSFGRNTDGGDTWIAFNDATPGYSNLGTDIRDLIPITTALYPNYPNPFNPRTAISFQLSAFSHVNLSIYNLNGQKLTTLVNGNNEAGTYLTNWNANSYASGVYLAVLSLDNKVFATQKLLYIK